MMYCTECGAQINDNAKVCTKCGVPVTGGELTPNGNIRVENHMVGAILSTIFCCSPIFGIIAIVYASQVNTRLAQGDIEGALSASKTANTWIIVNICYGFFIGALIILRMHFMSVPMMK